MRWKILNMLFKNTGLPNNKNIEKAYLYVLKWHSKRFNEALEMDKTSIDNQMKHQLEVVTQSGELDSEQLERLKAEQIKIADSLKKNIEKQLIEKRDKTFVAHVIEPALILANSNASEENAINAVLLLVTIRSPKDYDKIRKEFNSEVSDIIADILDVNSYPSEQTAKIPFLSDSSKRAKLSMLIGDLKSFIDIGKQLPQGQELILTTGHDGARKTAEFAAAVRGVDSKLDDLFVEVFNKVANYVDTGFKIKVDKKTNKLITTPFGGNNRTSDDYTSPYGQFKTYRRPPHFGGN